MCGKVNIRMKDERQRRKCGRKQTKMKQKVIKKDRKVGNVTKVERKIKKEREM